MLCHRSVQDACLHLPNFLVRARRGVAFPESVFLLCSALIHVMVAALAIYDGRLLAQIGLQQLCIHLLKYSHLVHLKLLRGIGGPSVVRELGDLALGLVLGMIVLVISGMAAVVVAASCIEAFLLGLLSSRWEDLQALDGLLDRGLAVSSGLDCIVAPLSHDLGVQPLDTMFTESSVTSCSWLVHFFLIYLVLPSSLYHTALIIMYPQVIETMLILSTSIMSHSFTVMSADLPALILEGTAIGLLVIVPAVVPVQLIQSECGVI